MKGIDSLRVELSAVHLRSRQSDCANDPSRSRWWRKYDRSIFGITKTHCDMHLNLKFAIDNHNFQV